MYFQYHNTIPQPFKKAFEQGGIQETISARPNPAPQKEIKITAASKQTEDTNANSSWETMLLVLFLMDCI